MQKGKHILREPITFPFGVLKNLVALCCLTVILTFDPPLGTNCSLVVPSRTELGATGVEYILEYQLGLALLVKQKYVSVTNFIIWCYR